MALLLVAWLALAGCASTPEEENFEEKPDFGKAAIAFGSSTASAVKNGAGAAARASGTAWRGVRAGFSEPEAGTEYGPYPKNYVKLVRRHFQRVLGYPEATSFQISRPEKGYMNKGLFQGGGVAWQGWIADVRVETTTELTKHRAEREYVIRLRDNDIVDVHTDGTLLKRVAEPSPAKQQ